MLRIGLTGGIGSGKSSVAALFAELGMPVIDMDVLAREVVKPGQPALQEIKKIFGAQICNEDDELNRRELRDIIFSDPDKRKQLEDIVHPRIRERVKNLIDELGTPYCIIVIPLLFETGRQDTIDRILVVDTSIENQLQRTMQRDNISEDYVQNIIATQVDRQTRLDQADDVINNTGDIIRLKDQVNRLHQRYLELSHNSITNS